VGLCPGWGGKKIKRGGKKIAKKAPLSSLPKKGVEKNWAGKNGTPSRKDCEKGGGSHPEKRGNYSVGRGGGSHARGEKRGNRGEKPLILSKSEKKGDRKVQGEDPFRQSSKSALFGKKKRNRQRRKGKKRGGGKDQSKAFTAN